MTPQVCAIIPARNEADVIAETIRGAQSIPGVSEIIVVDDASTDGTAVVSQAAGATQVRRLPRNLGKGGALNEALTMTSADTLLLLDADLGASSVEATKLLTPVLDGEADMTVAIFAGKSGGSEPGQLAAKSRGFGTVMKTARLGIWLMTATWVVSPLAGQRALKREIVDRAGGFAPKFGVEVGLTIDALRMGYRVLEVPVHMVHRASGRDVRGFVHRGRQMADMLKTLGRKALRK